MDDEEKKLDHIKLGSKFKGVADSNIRLDLIESVRLYSKGSKDEALELLNSIKEAPLIIASMLNSSKSELADEFTKLRFFSIIFNMLKSIKRYDVIVATIIASYKDKKHYPIELITSVIPFANDKEFINAFGSELREHTRELLSFLIDCEEQELVKPFAEFIKEYIEENFGDNQHTAIKALSLIKDRQTQRFMLKYIDDWDGEVRRLVLLYFMNFQTEEISGKIIKQFLSERDRRLKALLKHIIMNNFDNLKERIIRAIKEKDIEVSRDLLQIAFIMMEKKELRALTEQLDKEKRNYLLSKMYI